MKALDSRKQGSEEMGCRCGVVDAGGDEVVRAKE